MNARLIWTAAVVSVLSTGFQWPPPTPPPAASDTLEIAGNRLTMDSGVSRDFMPGITEGTGCGGPQERPLQGAMLLQPASGSIPADARPGRVWIQYEGGFWMGRLEESGRAQGVLLMRFEGGPRLVEGTRCGVIAELIVPGAGSGFVHDEAPVVFTY